jgi:hypothetical protein
MNRINLDDRINRFYLLIPGRGEGPSAGLASGSAGSGGLRVELVAAGARPGPLAARAQVNAVASHDEPAVRAVSNDDGGCSGEHAAARDENGGGDQIVVGEQDPQAGFPGDEGQKGTGDSHAEPQRAGQGDERRTHA